MRKHCSKVIVENFFEPCVLYLLMLKPSYGYELNQKLLENCGCNVNIGNLYRGLSRLAKEGYVSKKKVKSEVGPNKIQYSITDKGQELLKEWIEELEDQTHTITKLITNYKKTYETHIN